MSVGVQRRGEADRTMISRNSTRAAIAIRLRQELIGALDQGPTGCGC